MTEEQRQAFKAEFDILIAQRADTGHNTPTETIQWFRNFIDFQLRLTAAQLEGGK